ncbi:MAG TPA: PadR family transcriptional regulator [Thermoplasmatales archaeon]|nr:MAG: PadR family transcriptional regulator [Thermoplasmata archaeon]RLF58525.1 MAG: PadR family transcriptional regulator [Thermoplasmata archaeon]HDN50228.1 PadR family transcriptional regulator [Thermoplasmatales archaeon]
MWERKFFLGFIRIHLLYHADKGEIYGVEMMEELRRHGYAISPGTLYPILHSLERDGYLVSNSKNVHGKVRRYYRITRRGEQILKEARKKIRELIDEVME